MRLSLAYLLVAALLTAAAFPATIYVPDHHPAIQDAIDAAAKGDTIVVRPGTFVENVNFIGKEIVVRSEKGPEVTVIDGGRKGSCVVFYTNEGTASVIRGFSLINGTGIRIGLGEHGGGIYCTSSPTIRGNIIRGNEVDGRGGGIAVLSSAAPRILFNEILDNRADDMGGGIYSRFSNAEIRGNIIAGNCAGGSAGAGGGIATSESSSLIASNLLTGNVSDGMGGGVFCGFECTPIIEDNKLEGNRAGTEGGGLSLRYSSAIVKGTSFVNNSACQRGGALHLDHVSLMVIESCELTGNQAPRGGGIFQSISDVSGSGLMIARNTSENGGGIRCGSHSAISLSNATFFANSATSMGGGLLTEYDSHAVVVNSIFWENDASVGPEITLESASTLSIGCSDVDCTPPAISVGFDCTLSEGPGNIFADPLFVDALGGVGDLHLTARSPCKDAGVSFPFLPDEDIEGDPRVAFGTADMGADEYYPHLYHGGEVGPGKTVVFKAIGIPGAGSTLVHGPGLRNPPLQTPYGDLRLQWPLTFCNNGTFPAGGYSEKAYTLPTGLSSGQKLHYQLFTGGRLWNLMSLTVN